jgi:hypothetical protein
LTMVGILTFVYVNQPVCESMGENLNLLIHMGVNGVKQYIFLRSLVLEILLTFHE